MLQYLHPLGFPMQRLAFLAFFLATTLVQASEAALRIATEDWTPYTFLTKNAGQEHLTGFSTDVVTAVLQQMHVPIQGKITQYPWVRAEKMVIDGEADMLYTAAANEQRAALTYYPSESLLESSWRLFIRKDRQAQLKFDTLSDLKGKRIGVVRSYSYSPAFWEFIKAENNFEGVTNDEQNIKKLMANRVDYIVLEQHNGQALIKQMGLQNEILVLPKPLAITSLYAIFSRRTVSPDFVAAFSLKLKNFKKTNEYKTLYNHYFAAP